MHCKQADSAIMKLLLVQASNIFDHKTDFVVIMRFFLNSKHFTKRKHLKLFKEHQFRDLGTIALASSGGPRQTSEPSWTP